jgi:MFS family permease
MTSSQVQLAAIGWAVYTATGDALDLAWVGLAQFLPVLVLVLPAGHVADRFDRRLILGICYLGQAVVCAGFAIAVAVGNVGPPVIFALGLLMGTVHAFGNPAGQALLPALVPVDALARAIAVSSTLWQLATIVGPSVAGLVIAWGGGPVAALALAALLQLAAVALVATLPRPSVEPRALTWDNVVAGIRYVRDQRVLLACISLDLFAVLLGGATALLPIYATDVLHVGATGYGVLRSAPAVGAAIMAVFLALRPLDRRAGPVILGSVGLFGLATLVFGVSSSFPLSVGALVVLGAADMVSVVIRQTLVQLRTPDEMRGRVAAVNQVFIGASNELGEFESGLTARWFGAVPAVVAGGIGTLLVVWVWSIGFPELRSADRLVHDS